MPRQIDWQEEKKRVMAPDFPFDANNPCSGGVLEATRNYYQLDPPNAEAPDVVKLIHWGAGYILMKPNGRDPSSQDGKASRIGQPSSNGCRNPSTTVAATSVLRTGQARETTKETAR